MPTPTVCVFRGPRHILVSVNEAWHSRGLDTPPIGLPACEAWTDPSAHAIQALMDDVYRTGVAAAIHMPEGVMSICPWFLSSRQVAGVGTFVTQRPPAPESLPPREDLLAAVP